MARSSDRAGPAEVAITGGNFMLPGRFADAVHAACDGRAAARTLTLPWPDEPMEHGYARPGLDGLKEHQGDPEEVVAFVGAAPVLVTQLAPVSAAMLDRSEMTVGVIGCGQVGARVARLLRAFGCRVLVHDPYVQLSAADRDAGAAQAGLHALLRQSDVVTLHARVTAETTGMIGPAAFAVEPAPADWPLLRLPNVTLTPHTAGASVRTVAVAAKAAAEEVRRWLDGEPPLNPCQDATPWTRPPSAPRSCRPRAA